MPPDSLDLVVGVAADFGVAALVGDLVEALRTPVECEEGGVLEGLLGVVRCRDGSSMGALERLIVVGKESGLVWAKWIGRPLADV